MKLKDFKKLNENWSQWAAQGYPSGPRADLYDAIRDYSKELTGSRETYGDFDKLDSMSDEQLEEYYAGMKNSPEAQAVVDDAAAEEEAAMGVDTEYDKMPSQSGMGRGMRESAGGKLQYSVSNTGYGDVYEFFDENGEETEQTLGMMVLDLADAGVGGWAPEEQISRMMAVNADPSKNQGGMQKWDSSVFEDYYGADNQKILQAWAKMSGMELEQMPEAEDEYEDDGTNDFEEYYSESKKRNKVHEGRYHFANSFDQLDIGEDPRAQAFEQCIKILNELTYDSLEGDAASYADDAARLLWKASEELDYKRNQVGNVEEALSPEDERASEQAYAMGFKKGKEGMAVVDVCRGLTGIGHKACMAGHQDGANEFRQSLAERVRQTVVRKLTEAKGAEKK